MNKTEFLKHIDTHLASTAKPVVYVAGKVTGLPPAEVKAKFYAAQKKLEERGFTVLNPIHFIEPDADWQLAMRMASTLLNMADSIYLLPCWRDSEGAMWEFNQAVKFGISVMEAPLIEPLTDVNIN